ncbi:dTDP-4-dehydrorhamnose reductase [Marixanthomonas sp. SCSIO 43207]|uniref:dTDP-4-dehydrorhamnose reductase n=1 Tax=Marixanthomonas sp. SCSIO 43207 TaxID=2779360 RepID=UPI001CA8CC10|nr:dTDP-4-dehydrorhamnose reductase [Marixanthomonas sp. SCSIO 43207]UAB81926.1 dTDP-4-dehydrorhamnose reductase [Marixanthomonas sp. SCSIO 43207]
MKQVLVTGANGQLGKCIKDASNHYSNIQFTFTSKEELDITNLHKVTDFFKLNTFDYCINAAAYTNVEKAESEEETAFLVNAEAVKNLAETCAAHKTTLLHVSTDYVFDGTNTQPYLETDSTNPINVYGASKRKGEEAVINHCEQYFIVRTSWLYSQYGHNFFNSMIKYAEQGKPLTITTEQTGTPTNANDLAEALLQIIATKADKYGVYHFSNSGKATWYDFAKEILEITGLIKKTKLAQTDYYRTFAKRPAYSVLNTNKIESALSIKPVNWKNSLKTVLSKRIALH